VPQFRLSGEMKEMKQNCRVVSKWSLEKEIGLKKENIFWSSAPSLLIIGIRKSAK